MNVHFPFRMEGGFFSVGEIRWLKQETPGEMVCGISLQKRMPLRYPIYLAYETGAVEFLGDATHPITPGALLEKLLEDTYYLKRGVGICVRHLQPFFGRHSTRKTGISDPAAKATFDDYAGREVRNVQVIENALAQGHALPDDTAVLTPELLANVRQAAELEEEFVRFESFLHVDAAYPYLRSLQLLLSQIYGTYNMLVLLFLKIHGRSLLPNA